MATQLNYCMLVKRFFWFSFLFLFSGTQNYTFSSEIERPDFSELKQLHVKHASLIKTGDIRIHYVSHINRSQQEMNEAKKRFILPSNSPDPNGLLEKFLLPEQKNDLYENYVFDITTQKFKLNKKPADSNLYSETPYSKMDVNQIHLNSSGIELHYSENANLGIVGDFSNALANKIEIIANLGIISPKHFDELPQNMNVAVSESDLDGRKLVVYEITEPNSSNKMKIFVDPDLGYRYRQIESICEGGLAMKIVAKDYKLFDDVLFPTFYEEIKYSKDPNMPFRLKETFRILSAKFNMHLEPDVFTIKFSPETSIFDSKNGLNFKPDISKKTKLRVEEILEQAQNAKR